MPVHNADVAAIFNEIADLLEVQGANVFRIRAYRNAARNVGDLLSDLNALRAQGRQFDELPGIDVDLAAKIEEILATAKCAFVERLHHEVPPGAAQLLRVSGLGPKRVKALLTELDTRNLADLRAAAAGGRIHALRGFGRLDLPDAALARLDLVIGAVHSRFDLPRAQQRQRILRAMDHPCFTILAHPSGRLIGEREGYDVDMAHVLLHAKARGCFVEVNAQPALLDMWDAQCKLAQRQGVLVAVNSDAHSTLDFAHLRFGVGQARRGWLSKQDVLNTCPLKQLRGLLARTMLRTAS